MAPYGLNPCLLNTGCIVCLASWGGDKQTVRSSIHLSIYTQPPPQLPPVALVQHHSFFSPPISQIPQTFPAPQHPSLCPDRWWEEGGGSFINNANVVLVQKHYSEGNEKEKKWTKHQMSKNEILLPISLSLELCSWTNMHKTENQLLPEGCHTRKVEGVCVRACMCVCQSSLWSHALAAGILTASS